MVKSPGGPQVPAWVSLEDVFKRLSRSLGDNTDFVLNTILARGRVRVLAIRSDLSNPLPDQVQVLLSKACQLSVDSPNNLIMGVFQFASEEEGRQALGHRSTWIWLEPLMTASPPGPSIRPVTSLYFDQVQVCWADVTRELEDLNPGLVAVHRLPKLYGKHLYEALSRWAERKFNAKPSKTEGLPSRQRLLVQARQEVAPNVTETDVRRLRATYASPVAKKGGANFHRRSAI